MYFEIHDQMLVKIQFKSAFYNRSLILYLVIDSSIQNVTFNHSNAVPTLEKALGIYLFPWQWIK